MKNKFKMFALTAALVFSFGIKNSSATNYIGAYCGPDAPWSEDQTRNFISAWDSKGGVDQWLWSQDRFFAADNNSFVDWEDFTYYVGHGNRHLISHTNNPTLTDLSQAGNNSNGGWGGNGGGGYAKYVVFDSCMVVPGNPDGDWWTGWGNEPGGVWDGVLQLIGYRTSRYIATIASTPYGKKVANKERILQSWFTSVASVANHSAGLDFPSVTFCSGSDNDTYPNAMDAPCAGDYSYMYNTWEQ